MIEREPRDGRLERELRDLLRDRDGGPAPYGVRGRVHRIPDEVAVGAGRRWRDAALAVAGLAVAAAVVIAAWPRAGSGVLGPGAGPAPSSSPAVSFDPRLAGPGIVRAEPYPDAVAIVVLAVGALVVLAFVTRGRWRLLPIAGAVLVAAYVAVAALVPVELQVSGYGPRLNVAMASAPPGFDQQVLYETAEPGEPFVVEILLSADSMAPVSVDGFVARSQDDTHLGFPVWTAAWLDEERSGNGGMSGRAVPFEPFRVDGRFQSIHLVGRAGRCALGSAFDPRAPAEVDFASIDRVTVQVTVLGWARTIEVLLPFELSEPSGECLPSG